MRALGLTMRVLRRHLFRNVYILICVLLFCYYMLKTHPSDFEDDEGDWEEVKMNLVEGNGQEEIDVAADTGYHDKQVNEKVGVFPESGIIPGVRQIKRDWHDYDLQVVEAARSGPGEQGTAFNLPAHLESKKMALYDTNGFNALLSDQIPLDRSLKDIRHPQCSKTLYSEHLPTVSVVIPFFEEHFSTLLRTVVSVVNRSPKELLKQIILVDDGSSMASKEFLRAPLDDWLKEHMPIAQVIRLPERKGLIVARQEGFKVATADVVVVLDSHCEVMNNWLPPLLDPIVENYRTTVCPLIDVINNENFAYTMQDNGGRGAFDWRFYYKRIALGKEDADRLPEPFENPVMNGGLFAISRTFLWELGAYDPGLEIWGGEQYDLSFKIWQCGGRMFDAPCSRVGHVFRHGGSKRPRAKGGDHLSKNYKRVAVVWMDEYAEALYRRLPHLRNLDPGDVSKEIEIRERLKCKSFKWFLEEVAPDLLEKYPPLEPPDFANGTIKSLASPNLCLDTGSKSHGDILLYTCHGLNPQFFSLCWRKTIRVQNEQFCWMVPHTTGMAPTLTNCRNTEHVPSMTWRYDPETKQIQSEKNQWCLEAITRSNKVQMKACDSYKLTQKWEFKYVNSNKIAQEFPPFNSRIAL